MPVNLNDESRFEKFLERFPEDFIDNFINFYLFNGYYPKGFNKVLSEYRENKKEILSEFSNKKIKKAYIDLNEHFDILDRFLIKHFWIPRSQYEMHEDPPYSYLEPRYHHNFHISEHCIDGDAREISAKWDSYKNELDKIAENFNDAYLSFVKIAKEEIEKGNKPKGFLLSNIFWLFLVPLLLLIIGTLF